MSLFVALFCVCSFITVPSPVPFTMQSFALFLSCGLLGGKKGTFVTATYIILGILGLPVFSGMRGGISALFDVTGGYIFGFLLAALFLWLAGRSFGKNRITDFLLCLFANFVLYLTGALYLSFVYSDGGIITFTAMMTAGVLPYFLPDILKIILALYLTKRLRRFM